MVPQHGIKPRTFALLKRCSIAELLGRYNWWVFRRVRRRFRSVCTTHSTSSFTPVNLVQHTGFEPVISSLKGRRPSPSSPMLHYWSCGNCGNEPHPAGFVAATLSYYSSYTNLCSFLNNKNNDGSGHSEISTARQALAILYWWEGAVTIHPRLKTSFTDSMLEPLALPSRILWLPLLDLNQ